jgi:hypothetical protein
MKPWGKNENGICLAAFFLKMMPNINCKSNRNIDLVWIGEIKHV